MTNQDVDYLTEDPIINDQKFMCISLLKPSSIDDKNKDKNITVCGIKMRGSYDTYEEAKTRAEFLQKCDPYHNIYIGEVGKWCPFEDNPEKAKDYEYMNKDLNNLMKSYWKQQEEAKEYHEIRKQTMMNNIKNDNENEKEKEKKKNKKDKKDNEAIIDDINKEITIDKEKLDEEKKNIDENIKKLKELEAELDNRIKEINK